MSAESGSPRRGAWWPTLVASVCLAVVGSAATHAAPAANIDQIRNGAADDPNNPADWVNGNAGQENAHYLEGYSIAYRVRLTDMGSVIGTEIKLVLGFDIKHSGKHALDYLTSFDRLNPAGGPPHVFLSHSGPEVIDPTEDTAYDDNNAATVPAPDDENLIPCPVTGVSVDPDGSGPDPAASQPPASCQALPASEKQMRIWGGSISAVSYAYGVTCGENGSPAEGDLAANQSEGRIVVTFTPSEPTVVLSWGGHIARRDEWGLPGDPQSAGGISGSPYHMRLLSWCGHPALGNLGNQDRSLKAAAVFVPPDCALDCGDQTVCAPASAPCCATGTEGTAPYRIEWRDSSGALVHACDGVNEGGSCCFNFTDSDTYSADIIDEIGLTSDEACAFTLTVVDRPTASAGPDRQDCVEASGPTCFNVDGSGSNGTPSWSCTGSCAVSSGGNTFDPTICFAAGVTGSCNCRLTVTATPPCPDASDDVALRVAPQPTANAGDDKSTCMAESGQTCQTLNGSGSNGSPSWAVVARTTSPADCAISISNGNTFSPTVCFAAGCTGQATLELRVAGDPLCPPVSDRALVTVFPNPSCADEFNFGIPGEFTGTISGGTAPYASCSAQVVSGSGWSVGACTINGSSFRVTYSVAQPASENVTFRVTVVDAHGCTSSCEDTLQVVVLCEVKPAVQEVCDGQRAQFCVNAVSGFPPFTFRWTGPGGFSSTSQCITVGTAGVYTATVFDGLGFPSTPCTGELIVNPNPTCTVDPPSAAVCDGDSQQFCALPSSGTPPYDVEWRNSGGTLLANCLNVQAGGQCCFTTGTAGTYTASITDSKDCEGECDVTLTVDNCACRVTGGGNDTYSAWPWDGSYGSGQSGRGNSVDRYTFGGQAGAPTASQPQPYGEWTHVNHRGPSGKFTFHAGTASAPDDTEIDLIRCCDKDNCNPARPAPSKQIDFQGRGVFKNISGNPPVATYATVGESIHWFEVNIDDLGEPGNRAEPGADCPAGGFECTDDSGGFAKCACADFYRIKIYSEKDPPSVDSASIVIYQVEGYITGGNFQIHPPIDH